MYHVNLIAAGNNLELQVLMPAPEYCTGFVEAQGKTPQIYCVLPTEYLFLIEEAQTSFFPNLNLENVIKEGKRLSMVSFIFTPIRVPFKTLSGRLKQDNPTAEQLVAALEKKTIDFTLHFDYLFFPAFRDRLDFVKVCREARELEFCLCKSGRLWTKESGPMYVSRQKISHKKLNSADRMVQTSEGASIVL